MNFIKNNFLFSIIFSLIIIVSNLTANFFINSYYIFNSKHTIQEFIITFILGFLLSFIKNKLKVFFSSFFIFLNFIDIGYFYFFRTHLPSYQIELLFSEYKDIIDSLASIKLIIFLLILLSILSIYIIYKISRVKTLSNKYTTPFLVVLIIIFPIFIRNHTINYMPNSTHFGYINTLFSFEIFISNRIFKPYKEKIFKAYIVKKLNTQKPIIIVIMGESLNYKRMSLFGFNYKTTPLLDSLKNDNNFIYKKAISSGVNTPVGVASFFYIKREPENVKLILSQKTNILKLARENNYTTYWLSMQEEGTGIFPFLNNSDFVKTRKDFKDKYDDNLLNELKKINFSKKTFVVLHLRANHSPYEEYTPKLFYKWSFNYKDYHKYKLFTYLNSVLYVDNIIYGIIEYMKENYKNFIIYYVSDHSEMLGFKSENGKYGHSQLVFGDTFIPFLYYSDKYHKNLNKNYYNHYLISKMLAEDLGYEIINPNENKDIYYINNVKLDGRSGYLKYELNSLDKNDTLLR